nr:hypothetical protein CFP56_53239 [Quercus suber]
MREDDLFTRAPAVRLQYPPLAASSLEHSIPTDIRDQHHRYRRHRVRICPFRISHLIADISGQIQSPAGLRLTLQLRPVKCHILSPSTRRLRVATTINHHEQPSIVIEHSGVRVTLREPGEGAVLPEVAACRKGS